NASSSRFGRDARRSAGGRCVAAEFVNAGQRLRKTRLGRVFHARIGFEQSAYRTFLRHVVTANRAALQMIRHALNVGWRQSSRDIPRQQPRGLLITTGPFQIDAHELALRWVVFSSRIARSLRRALNM